MSQQDLQICDKLDQMNSIILANESKIEKIYDKMNKMEIMLAALINNIEIRCYKCNCAISNYDDVVKCKYWNECFKSICRYCVGKCDNDVHLCNEHQQKGN